ncbi:hypothetical protein ASPZODRAFT_55031 [Penicilliopsis zonata CBS 506.65]|uniref:Peptidase A1 domain-containing protein n=1 Tax=Penicilliopsis zonata CBS 506.65 TaxID=1073090 RepID=A0A1L9SVH3_9EURO|nr:hypothetical protein ASPZODRAFT_55031 [Penicilliopsis zonata CBS 506.65]OJJ51178.1 hypothetical protein ASPZODRAFT_55031 [Penicilliopsis zonata CBS 506.65]
MKFLSSFVVMLCLSYETVAAPTPARLQRKGTSYKVERVRREGFVADGASALRKAYSKYGITASTKESGADLWDFEPYATVKEATSSSAAASSASASQTGEVTATSADDGSEFVSPVIIGGQTINMDFDTGSADLWVFSSELPSEDQEGHTIFEVSESSTFELLEGETFEISYGDGSSAAGVVGTDTVNIGGVTVTSQAVELPTTISAEFIEDTASNGLVGFAFSNINAVSPDQQKTFFANAADSMDEPVLTAQLTDDGTGEYELGYIDTSKYTGEMANITIDSSNGYWEFASAEYAIGSGDTQSIEDVQVAIADTGTTLMLSSPDVVEAFYAEVDSAQYSNSYGGYVYPCSATLPDLSVAVGSSHLVTIPGSLLTYCEIGTSSSGETVCYGGLQSSGDSEIQIYGDIFLRSLFVVFDLRGPSMGFAARA